MADCMGRRSERSHAGRAMTVKATCPAPRAKVLTDEMRHIAEEFRALTVSASIATPAINELRSFIPRPDQNDTNLSGQSKEEG